jgi:hypothetical protein
VKVSRKEQLGRIEHLASLWDRLVTLYLDRHEFEDVSAGKEKEFLALQGSIMEELAAVAEFEEGRFALVDEVTSVVNEAISVRHLKEQSEFQVGRRKQRGRQVAEIIANFQRFIAERDSTAVRREKEFEARLARPFWDPEQGKFGAILGRVLAFPVRFYAAIRIAGEAKKANSFLLALLTLLSVACLVIVAAFNGSVVRTISYNVALESGILTSDAGVGAKIVIWLLICVGIAVVGLAGAVVAAILAHLLVILMHLGFKTVGAKGGVVASHKVVAFGLAPLLLLVTLPFLGYLVGQARVPASALVVPVAVAACYMAVLHVIGFKKVHNAPVVAGIAGWLIGAILFAAVVLGALWIWHASVEGLPPSSGKYVYVTSKKASLFRGKEAVRTLSKGKILEFRGEEDDFFTVQVGKDEGKIKKSDAQVREASLSSLPWFLLESSAVRAEALIDRLSREIKK